MASQDPKYADVEKQNEANGAVPAEHNQTYDVNAEKASSNSEPEIEAPVPQMKNPMMDPSSFPDGGVKAWSTVFGAWCALFVSFGEFSIYIDHEAITDLVHNRVDQLYWRVSRLLPDT
jgi:hypothetical protein